MMILRYPLWRAGWTVSIVATLFMILVPWLGHGVQGQRRSSNRILRSTKSNHVTLVHRCVQSLIKSPHASRSPLCQRGEGGFVIVDQVYESRETTIAPGQL
jgi:hypothetical protein